LTTEPEITSTLAGESDTIKTEAPETLLPEVIEPDFPKLATLFPEVAEPKEPQPSSPVSLGPPPSLPLSQIKPPIIYLGPIVGPLPYRLVSIDEIPQEESHQSTLVHWGGLHFYHTGPLPLLQNPTQTPLPYSLDLPADFLHESSLGLLTMTRSYLISQPVSITMVETSNVSSSSMFETSLEAHLYGGLSIPPGYQCLFGTFFGATSSPLTSPMSSTSGNPSSTSLMNATYPAPSPPLTPTI